MTTSVWQWKEVQALLRRSGQGSCIVRWCGRDPEDEAHHRGWALALDGTTGYERAAYFLHRSTAPDS